MFAVQHQGWCASSRRAHLTYGRYGKSNRCRNGKGGPWANDVYVLRGEHKLFFLSLSLHRQVSCDFVASSPKPFIIASLVIK